MSNRTQEIPAWVGITYLIYVALVLVIVVGGTGYAVFVLGHSGWWFALAILFCAGTYRPGRWAEMVTGDAGFYSADGCRDCREDAA